MVENLFTSIQSYFHPTYDWIPTSNKRQTSYVNPTYSQQFSGKLLLRQEIPLEDKTFDELISSNQFFPIEAIEHHLWGPRCRRCGNKTKRLFAEIPCARCHKSHSYCRKCIEMGRIMDCEPLYYWLGPKPDWPIQDNACAWQGELTRYQQKASDKITATMLKGNAELLVWAVCGAGKTEMLFDGINQSIRQNKRVCLATPRADVVRELVPRFCKAFPHTEIEGLYGGSEQKQGKGQLIISTTHQLFRFAHAFDVIIIDEIDAFPFHVDPSLPFAARRAAKPDAAMIYLTATPRKEHRKRADAKKLATVFVPVRFHGYPLPVPTLHMCFSLRKSLQKFQAPTAFNHWFQNRTNPNRQLLIFVPTIDLAEKLTDSLVKQQLIKDNELIASVHASDPDREEKVLKFRNKDLFVLVTTTILERGVTFPSVDVVVFDAGHQVFDEAALVQIAGRAGRSPDDPTGEVIFYHDGKTDAIVNAVRSIKAMNRRGRKL